eukprot:265613-Rhodomonas_salina.1
MCGWRRQRKRRECGAGRDRVGHGGRRRGGGVWGGGGGESGEAWRGGERERRRNVSYSDPRPAGQALGCLHGQVAVAAAGDRARRSVVDPARAPLGLGGCPLVGAPGQRLSHTGSPPLQSFVSRVSSGAIGATGARALCCGRAACVGVRRLSERSGAWAARDPVEGSRDGGGAAAERGGPE